MFIEELGCYYHIAKLFQKSFIIAAADLRTDGNLRLGQLTRLGGYTVFDVVPSMHHGSSPEVPSSETTSDPTVQAAYFEFVLGTLMPREGRSWDSGSVGFAHSRSPEESPEGPNLRRVRLLLDGSVSLRDPRIF